jgi:ABC-type multidrug transport system permease subunit
VTARSRVWFNPDLHSRNYFVPGVIANIIMMVTMILTALSTVRGIFLKGAGVDVLWPQMAAMAAYGIAVLCLSAMRFQKKLD